MCAYLENITEYVAIIDTFASSVDCTFSRFSSSCHGGLEWHSSFRPMKTNRTRNAYYILSIHSKYWVLYLHDPDFAPWVVHMRLMSSLDEKQSPRGALPYGRDSLYMAHIIGIVLCDVRFNELRTRMSPIFRRLDSLSLRAPRHVSYISGECERNYSTGCTTVHL